MQNPKLLELRDLYQPLASFIESEADRIAFGHQMRCRIVQAYRDPKEQDQKFAQGYSQVRGGYSWHQYHLAFDLGLFDDSSDATPLDDADDWKTYITSTHPRYAQSIAVYEAIGHFVTGHSDLNRAGVFWGGRFPDVFHTSFIDLPHYEWHPPFSVKGGAAQVISYKSHPLDIPLDRSTYPPLPLTSTPMPVDWKPSPEQEAAFSDMIGIGVYKTATPDDPGTPKTRDRYESAVLIKRIFHAGDARWVRRDGVLPPTV